VKKSCGHPEDLLIYRPQVRTSIRRRSGSGRAARGLPAKSATA